MSVVAILVSVVLSAGWPSGSRGSQFGDASSSQLTVPVRLLNLLVKKRDPYPRVRLWPLR